MFMLLIPILLPMIAGAIMPRLKFPSREARNIYVGIVTILNSVLLFNLLLRGEDLSFSVLRLTEHLTITLKMDGLSRVFCALIAFLWPLAAIYAFEYMEHEHDEGRFFIFYTMSYGVTAGVAMAGNLFTLYAFYELLTLATLPLVTHKMDVKSVHAGRRYLYYSISGAALAFIGLIFIMTYGTDSSTAFRLGGVLDMAKVGANKDLLLLVFVLAFIGFGAKAAVFPMHAWLPTVSVAPTPVTALLHAVAVVKSGAFAIIRIIYYSFGADFLHGTWAQMIVVLLAAFTIAYGSVMAVREQHFKRRLAYSTVSNLSYILLGAALMTPAGLTGALTHMLYHGVMKITLFFCVGAVLVKTEQEYVQDLRGFSRVMPRTMLVFTIASLALVGVPPMIGFASKWNLASAAAMDGQWFSFIGMGGLIISAILTAVYLFTIIIPAYTLPVNAHLKELTAGKHDPGLGMSIPFALLIAAIIILSFCSVNVIEWLSGVANGLY